MEVIVYQGEVPMKGIVVGDAGGKLEVRFPNGEVQLISRSELEVVPV